CQDFVGQYIVVLTFSYSLFFKQLTKYIIICFFLPEVKPGACPKYVLAPLFKHCADKCSNDYDCPLNEKCCYQGCGRVCVTINQVKPGECPKYDLVPYFEPCADKCHNDYDCADHEKCCYHGCGRQNLSPYTDSIQPVEYKHS
uniref:WAP domain-containing protein n=1 Tax=Gouania willdenowi TaxID=441366 RepID=A0A8C5DD30_GOUWI